MKDGKTLLIGIVAVLFFIISFRGCFKNNNSRSYNQQRKVKYEKSPVDKLIQKLSNEQNFSIILYDMDYNESSDQYKHKYNVMVEREDSVYVQETDWANVSSTFFNTHIDHMGMEIAAKKDGKVTKNAAPAGYTNYIGNERYGQWQTRNGSSFWAFYGKYAFISSMFRMTMFPVRHSYWNDYHSNYYGYGKPYYGPVNNGQRMYGTNSSYANANNNSRWNSKPSSFKSNVRSRVKRSTTTSKRTNYTRSTRTSSRYSRSSTRSRGGSFGK